jgi:hypothetical protein
MARRNDHLLTGNIGLYYVCYRLSCLGWNAMPTARNARGIDILAYNRDCTKVVSLQVKALSKRAPVPLGTSIDALMGDYWIVVNDLLKEPTIYILEPGEVRKFAHRGEKDGRISYWLQPREYATDQFRDQWQRLGSPV